MAKSKAALQWIVNILNKNNVPFQIVGGLAAKAYGAKRPLVDIDLYIPRKGFGKIINHIKPYITWGPGESLDASFEDYCAELNYKGQAIDVAAADDAKVYDKKAKKWEELNIDFSKSTLVNIFGIEVSVMPKEQLIWYKTLLSRDVDKEDLEYLI